MLTTNITHTRRIAEYDVLPDVLPDVMPEKTDILDFNDEMYSALADAISDWEELAKPEGYYYRYYYPEEKDIPVGSIDLIVDGWIEYKYCSMGFLEHIRFNMTVKTSDEDCKEIRNNFSLEILKGYGNNFI